MVKIYTPTKGYTGLIAGVSFVNGVGETNSKYLIGWFKEKGYIVEEETIEQETVEEDLIVGNSDIEKEDPYSGMIQAAISEDMEELTVKELKDIAKSIKIENYSTMNKDELIDAISKV